ncbi:hypothetical protein EBB59_07665 [Lysobacter pythonis]|uniref:ATP synthase subunit I n=1 Tax=Solilutibacter pythonis TaxID=2483112 RepID=A0A3M2I0Z0_9GAMM|nr:hypothetical protein [Lysobacter pythonis]RMH92832.1 hypothetical protein EBB59_07665 [Lysobacter pythonis]
MYDPVARSKRMVRQAALRQMLAVALAAVAAGFLAPGGLRFGLGVFVGGLAVALGNWLAARIALAGGVAPANVVLVRWFAGIVVRWGVFLAVMVGAVAAWKLPPLALLIGVLAALVAYVVSVSLKTVRNSNQ